MSIKRFRDLLIKHEGLRLKAYRDTVGKLTIGVGRNLEDVGVSEFEAMVMLNSDIERVQKEAVQNFPWFKSISVTRQDVVLSMIFNLGLEGFKKFKKMTHAIQIGNYDEAANQMLASQWAMQVKIRAVELAQMMRSGVYS